MTTRRFFRFTVASLACLALLGIASGLRATPTYKLGVKPELKPLCTVKLDGTRISRTDLDDDPGFRLQYHFKKDGKTVQIVDARAMSAVEVPQKEAGTYTVVLELFYPGYKVGTGQKGEFKPVSNVLTFKVEAGMPAKVTLIETPAPAPTPPAPPKK
jgi:hypothetical protein